MRRLVTAILKARVLPNLPSVASATSPNARNGWKADIRLASEELAFVDVGNAEIIGRNIELLPRLLHEGHGTMKTQ